MATVKPIRGIRFTPQAGAMAELVTPPYDVIDASAQEQYYQRHPNNIIRLEYGKVFESDNQDNNRYSRAAECFFRWLEQGVLAPDPEPALYLYEQEFQIDGRTMVRSGMFCGVKIEPYERGVVLPHEETLPKHKADRLALMRACGANFSPIFSLYSDPQMVVDSLLRSNKRVSGEPDVAFGDENGHRHRLWVINEPGIINEVQKVMEPLRVYIADGHHRYETAMNYRNEKRAEEGDPAGDRPYDYVIMTLVNLYDPGLVVLPTHRLVKNVPGFKLEVLLAKAGELFDIEELALGKGRENLAECLAFLSDKFAVTQDKVGAEVSGGRPVHNHAFGLYAGGGKFYTLTLKENTELEKHMPADKSKAWKQLDVSVLHTLILEKYLGIGGEQRASESNLTYTREDRAAMDKVDSGEYQMVFIMNPTLVEEVIQVAAKGEKMPQKSTFFYPKLITGLLINRLK